MLLYYITDRTQFRGDERVQRRLLLDKIGEAACSGVDYIQLREKDLPVHELERLAREALQVIHANQLTTGNRKLTTAFLINSRSDVAIAVGADGVHLRSDDISPGEARALWTQHDAHSAGVQVAVSCHSADEVAAAASQSADLAVFAPVFEKQSASAVEPAGLERLRQASRHNIPVLALGGVTVENAPDCMKAGAAGIAGIRLFQQQDISEVVQKLGHKT